VYKQILESIFRRFKKLFLIIILLPLLTGIAAYFIENNSPTNIQAKTEVSIGLFEDSQLNDLEAVKNYLKSTKFEETIQDSNFNPDSLEKLQLTTKPGRILEIKLNGSNESVVQKELKIIVNQFLDVSNQKYNEYSHPLEAKISELEKISPSSSEVFDKERLIFEIEAELKKLKKTTLTEEIETTVSQKHPLRSATLGFIIGIVISFSVLLIPEIFREEK
jgi:teichuronic acid biosynthesis protein TuaF